MAKANKDEKRGKSDAVHKSKDKKEKKAKAAVLEKKAKADAAASAFADFNYADLVGFVQSYAQPLLGADQAKKIFGLLRASVPEKAVVRGVKEVTKAIRKQEKGIVVIAGDVQPLDCIAHIPTMCRDAKVKCVFLPSKMLLGVAISTPRAASCVLVQKTPATASVYDATHAALH